MIRLPGTREPAFAEMMADVRRRLRTVYGGETESMAAVLITGSGTSAVEAMVGTLVPSDRPALVCANGVYGERIAQILTAQGKQPILLRQEYVHQDQVDVGKGFRKLQHLPS